MSGETVVTVVGNLTADPELRYTQNGKAVASLTVAAGERQFDREANEWKDGDSLFLRCSVWGEVAERVALSLHKGNRVMVTGALKQRSYQTKPTDGTPPENRTSFELRVIEIGASLKYATVAITRVPREDAAAGAHASVQTDSFLPAGAKA